MRLCLFDWQHFQDAAVKSGRSPPDPHVPPFATYELGVLYAQDEKVSKMLLNFRLSRFFKLKGLGQAILGNFSTDQMVIELTKISK